MTEKGTGHRQSGVASFTGLPQHAFADIEATMKPREMTPAEEAKLLPEITALTNATFACSRMAPAEFDKYRGEFVAWSPDGTSIIGHAPDRDDLTNYISKVYKNPNLCVIQFIDDTGDRV